MRFRTVPIRALTVLIALLVGLLLVEAYFRIFRPQPDFHIFSYAPQGFLFNAPHYDDDLAVISDNVVFWWMKIRQYSVSVRTNSRWLRSDREFSYEKPNRTFRTLLLGDSIGFGFPIPYEKTFGKLLETAISGSETVNASSILAHTARNLQVYEREAYKYGADAVVLQGLAGSPSEDHMALDQFWSDWFEMKSLSQAGYDVRSALWKDVAGNPVLRMDQLDNADAASSFLNRRIGSGPQPWYGKFHWYRFITMAGSRFVSPVRSFLSAYQEPALSALPPNSPVAGAFSWNAVPALGGMSRIDLAPFAKTLAYVEALHSKAEANGSRFLYVLVPNRMGCSGKFRTEWTALLSELERKGIESIQFFDDFCNSDATPKPSLFLEEEIHINEEANAIIAEKIAQVLKNTPR